MIGSTREARQAGTKQANTDTTASTATAAEKLNTSSGLTSNSRFERDRVAINAPPIPTAEPSTVRIAPSRDTWEMTLPRVAPSAIRTPNSRVRCDVA